MAGPGERRQPARAPQRSPRAPPGPRRVLGLRHAGPRGPSANACLSLPPSSLSLLLTYGIGVAAPLPPQTPAVGERGVASTRLRSEARRRLVLRTGGPALPLDTVGGG